LAFNPFDINNAHSAAFIADSESSKGIRIFRNSRGYRRRQPILLVIRWQSIKLFPEKNEMKIGTAYKLNLNN
jgi:hypothetical protein